MKQFNQISKALRKRNSRQNSRWKSNNYLRKYGCRNDPYEHATLNQRRYHVNITSIRQRPNFEKFPRHFHVLFRCNFADRKPTLFPRTFLDVISMIEKSKVFSTYFFRHNFAGRNIHVFCTYFFPCNFDGRKIHVVSLTFFDAILMVEKSTLFECTFFHKISTGKISTPLWVKLRVNENILGGSTLTFARLFSLNFSSKSPWCSPVRLKFESYNLQHFKKKKKKKNWCKLVFWVFTEQLLYHMIFARLHCYEVTLIKNCNRPPLQKSETKILDKKTL